MSEQQGQQKGQATPQYSPDGRWWWDGQQWTPVPEAPPEASLTGRASRSIGPKQYPPWIAPLLGFPLFLCGLAILLGILMIVFPTEDQVGERQAASIIIPFFLAIGGYLSIALWGIVRKAPWGRGAATVAALLMALTGVGLLIAIPILLGLWRSAAAEGAPG